MKIAIIGAGINGLYLAWKLSQKGNSVTVFEKKEKIGKKACSGLFSERILKFIPQSRSLVENEIKSVLIHFPKRTLKVQFSKRFLVMSHFELDKLAAELAQKAGAKIVLSNPISELPQGFDKIIGADGPASMVRKSLGLAAPNCRLAVQGFIPESDSSGFLEAWPINQGFIWKIPRKGETEYGAIGNIQEVKPLFGDFLKKNNLQLYGLESALIPQGFSMSSNPSVALCGDAAGLTKPWSGGGVVWGLMAAEILLKTFPNFLKYSKLTKRFFLPRIAFSRIATRAAYFFGFNFPRLFPKNIKIESDFLY
ncbi:MAG: FAD-dependent oxidoreductase [bacterium]